MAGQFGTWFPLPCNHRVLLHAANLRHGTDGSLLPLRRNACCGFHTLISSQTAWIMDTRALSNKVLYGGMWALRNLPHVPLLAPRILKRRKDFWRICRLRFQIQYPLQHSWLRHSRPRRVETELEMHFWRNWHVTLTLFRLTTYTYIRISRTAPLTSRRCILNIYSANIRTEYFKHTA
jgi:hypothetical protein